MLRTKRPLFGRHSWLAVVSLLSLFLFIASCSVSRSPVTGKKRAYGYSWQQELQIGKEADGQIIAQYGLYDDPELTAYVNRIGQAVLAQSHMRRPDTPQEYRDTQFTFRVLDSPIVNAFALPGGYIYFTRGLLAHLENEAQLAVVMGHEIGHVAARHASQRALEGTFGQLGLIGGAIAGEVFLGQGAGGQILQQGSQAMQLLFLKYGRDDERESDKLGVEYSAMDGYMAGEGAAFFGTLKRLSEKSGQSIPSFLSSHPDPGEREVTITKLAEQWTQQYTMTKTNQDELYKAIDGMVVGDDPRQGYVENNVFLHPTLKFQFPAPNGWALINQPSMVAMVESNQKAIMMLTLEADADTPQAAAAKLGQEEGIQVVNSRADRVNNLPAHWIRARASQQNGGTIDLLAYYISYDGNLYRMLGYAATNDFSQYERSFLTTMRGFRTLTDPKKLSVQPNRLNITQTSKNGSFQTFVPSKLPSQFTPEDLAILNQLQLGSNVTRGTRLKLVN